MLKTLCVDYGENTKKASVYANSTTESIFTFRIRDGEVLRTLTDQLWFWSDEWQAGERNVDKYIREGNVQEFDSMDEFLGTLSE